MNIVYWPHYIGDDRVNSGVMQAHIFIKVYNNSQMPDPAACMEEKLSSAG